VDARERGRVWEACKLPGERVEEADVVGALVTQHDETTGGGTENVLVAELGEVHQDALPGRDVHEFAALPKGAEGSWEHDPPLRVEPAVQASVRVRGRGASPPRPAYRAEAEVVGDVDR
jgi:hypothetical protein